MANDPQMQLANITMKSNEYDMVAEELVSVYANNVNLAISPWDVALNFGEILGERDGRPLILHKTKVSMSKELAKVLNLLLTAKLNEYEDANGVIKIPEIKIKESIVNELPKRDAPVKTKKS